MRFDLKKYQDSLDDLISRTTMLQDESEAVRDETLEYVRNGKIGEVTWWEVQAAVAIETASLPAGRGRLEIEACRPVLADRGCENLSPQCS